jgi:hypothetical protein
MKKLLVVSVLGLALVIALGFGFIPSLEQTAYCQGCSSEGIATVRNIFQEFRGECAIIADSSKFYECFEEKNIYPKLVKKMKGFADAGKFGPRNRIIFPDKNGATQKDTINGKESHIYLSGTPLGRTRYALAYKVENLARTDKVEFIICTVDIAGQQTLVKTIKWDGNDTSIKNETFVIDTLDIFQIEVKASGQSGGLLRSNPTYSMSVTQK